MFGVDETPATEDRSLDPDISQFYNIRVYTYQRTTETG
jgi:hypothetical protein